MTIFNTIKKLSVIALVVTTSACSSTYHIPVYKNVADKVQSTDVTLGLNQEEIYVDFVVAQGGGGGYGILGALIAAAVNAGINSSSSEDAEKLAIPLRNATVDVNFSSEFTAALNNELKKINWLNANKTYVRNSYKFSDSTELTKDSASSAVLLVTARYYVKPDINAFNIDTVLKLIPNSPALIALANKNKPDEELPYLYRNRISFTFKLPSAALDKEAAIYEWVKNDGKKLITALRKGIGDVAHMIALDLSNTVDSNVKSEDSDSKQEVIVASGENYKIARMPTGNLVTTIN